MLRNYFKSAFRILLKNKLFSFINIIGLGIAMAASLLIFQHIAFELSYDRFHESPENIFRVQHDRYIDGELRYQKAQSFIPFGETINSEYPEVIDYTTLFKISDEVDVIITYFSDSGENLKFAETEVYHVKGNFFNIFNLSIIEGNPDVKSVGKGEVLISQSVAEKYFGDQSALNKSLNHSVLSNLGNSPDYVDFKVVGVFEDTPDNSHIKFDFLFGWLSVSEESRGGDANNWHWDGFYNYVRLHKDADVSILETKFPNLINKYMSDRPSPNQYPVFSLQPLTSIHLHSNLLGEVGKNGSLRSVSILFILGFLILSIAWANYINLSTAKALERSKEVGIRKSVGSTKSDLMKLFLIESFIVNLMAMLLAVTFTQLISNVFFQFNWQEVSFGKSNLLVFSTGYVALVAIGSFLSGIYPALILSSFPPSSILKGNIRVFANHNIGYLRKGMVIFQFIISISLIAGAVAIFKQVSFMQEKELGINIDQTLVIKTFEMFGPPGSNAPFLKLLEVLKDKLSSYPVIKGATASLDIPGQKHAMAVQTFKNMNDMDKSIKMYYSRIDSDFMEMFEAKLMAGRNFYHQKEGDDKKVIINIEALQALGYSSPDEAIGAKVTYGSGRIGELEVIGVVDFRATSFKEQNYPVTYQSFYAPLKHLSVKMNITGSNQVAKNIQLIRDNWESTFPDKPFDYFFLDELFNRQYESEQQFSKLLNLFTGLAIFIACLGLYGLSLFTVRQKTKEIGIRKVLGASIQSLIRLLTRDLIILVFIAGLIAMPLVRILLNLWLENYPYKTAVSWWVFICPVVGVALIAVITISRQVFKAAFTNPVDSLRNE